MDKDSSEDETEGVVGFLDALNLEEMNRKLGYLDILELSFSNPSMREKIKETSVPVQTINVVFGKNSLVELTAPKRRLVITFGDVQGVEFQNTRKFEFEGRIFNFKKSGHGYHADEEASVSDIIGVLKYLPTAFNCANSQIKWVSLDMRMVANSDAILETLSTFETVGRLSIYGRLMHKQNFKAFEKKFENFVSALNINDVLTLDHICLRESAWMTVKDLCNIDAITAILLSHNFNSLDVNKFIKHWLQSTSTKLYWLELSQEGNGFDQTEVMQGLDIEPDTYTERNIVCSCPHRRFAELTPIEFLFPLKNYQITRPHDGVKATLSFKEHSFFFHVKNDGPITPPPPPMPVTSEDDDPLVGETNCSAYVSRLDGTWYYAVIGPDGEQTRTDVSNDEVYQYALQIERMIEDMERRANQ
ncbi:unnamed protein product [Caenorhabditis brenneri]